MDLIRTVARLVLVVAVAMAVVGAPPAAAATVLTVDRTDDDAAATACVAGVAGDCSLRGALINANSDGVAEIEEIHVPAGTYGLTTDGDSNTTGSLDVEYSAKIIGAGSATTIIDGNDIDGVLAVSRGAGPITERTVEISGLTLRDGSSCAGTTGQAGGAYLYGVVTMNDVVVEDNESCNAAGGIFVPAFGSALTMTNSVVRNNTAANGAGGLLTEGTTSITESTISGNTSSGAPGGGVQALGTLTINRSTISGNTARGNGGGLIAGNNAAGAAVTLINSTVSGNVATYYTSGTPQPFPGTGAGIYMMWSASLVLQHATITANTSQNHPAGSLGSAGGVYVGGGLVANNSIISGNVATNDCRADGAPPTGTSNLVGVDACALPGPADGSDPMLGGLADNGGPTQTHALPQSGSPALDAGNADECEAVDQRAVARPYGSGCDIGAFEFSLAPPNSAPTVNAGPNKAVAEGSPAALAASADDPDDDPLTAAWDWEADSDPDAGFDCDFSAPAALATAFTCTDDGIWQASVTVSDGEFNASDSARVTVTNVRPSVTITAPADYAQRAASTAVNVVAPITDPGTNDTHVCSISWGNGTTTAGVVSGDTCTGSHTYGSIGVRVVTVKVTDDDGGTDTAQVTVVSTNAHSLVTGGGWVTPAGARTSFGFVVLRKDGRPQGQMIVQAPSGKRFKASMVRNLVVGDPRASWNGKGRWGSTPGCPYTLTVTDGRLVSDTAPDRFSLTVRSPGGAVLLDIDRAPLKGGWITVYLNRL